MSTTRMRTPTGSNIQESPSQLLNKGALDKAADAVCLNFCIESSEWNTPGKRERFPDYLGNLLERDTII